ncbi:hypothetical protein Scep_002380 [Stephania cephalantha]|uniref:mitogen-activated protein kinase kinase kinase n=1 Tax=Stephania cephalantha TaxID=152367 RepID=A0AAP0LDV4_9MAGN
MPAWWGRKSNQRNKEEEQHQKQQRRQSRGDEKRSKEKAKSFDETIMSGNSDLEVMSKDFVSSCAASCSAVVGSSSSFDSDLEKRGHPLPRPSVSSAPALIQDHGVGLGSGSVSVSSVSSSGSSDEPPLDFGFVGLNRGRGETKFSPRARSPNPGVRASNFSMSPLHTRACGVSPDSPTRRQEEGRTVCHPLPLPPGSPTKPSGSSIARSVVNESSHCFRVKWKRGKLLGRGTFGHVYLGFNSENGQMCAIKEVRVISDDQTSKECLRQLNQEISLLGQLSHPNIVQYYGSELEEETLSVYLEYVSGGSIHKLLQEYGPFREPVIQSYTRQILSGLAYLHGRNTVHRDIKGANILVDPNGEIKLADFGMAKHITSCCSMLSFKGSPYWMAPEVIMNSSGYSLAVDIWSLGCTILEMVTSKPPWSQYEGVAAIFKIGNSKDIPEIPDHLSNDLKNFLMLCLQREPSARPTAAQLLEHPFVRDQVALKVPKMNLANDVFPSSVDGSHTPPSLDFQMSKVNLNSQDGDNAMRHMAKSSRAIENPRDNLRLNMSLPVSPCSSPIRNYGPSYRSCFLSPPHPSYMLARQSNYNLNNHSILSARQYAHLPTDEWVDLSQIKAQTPGGSPRRRRHY